MDLILENSEDLKLTENHLKQLHSTLLKYSSKDVRHRGEYKKLDNHVVAFDAKGKEIGIVFKTATPFKTPMKMADLIEPRSVIRKKFPHKTPAREGSKIEL